jgi:succinoglycan biosynthesis transport protein ExoP
MNQLFGQSTDAVRDGDGDLAPSSVGVRPLPVGGAEQAFFHLDVKRSLQLNWRLALKIAIGGAVLALAYFLVHAFVFKTWPVYEAESLVYVQPTAPKVLELSQGGSPRWPFDTNTYETYIQQQMMNVTRDDVLASALKKIGDFQEKGESEQAAARRLVQDLSVVREGSAYQFFIVARASSPEFAADIANDVTAAYMESTARDQRSGDEQRLSMLRDEKDRIGKALDTDRAEQADLNKQLGVASVGGTIPDHYDQDIAETRTELIRARTDHDAAEAKFASLGAGTGPSSAAIDAEADELIANDAGLVSMKTTLNQRRATLITQMANLTSSHPQYKQDEVELAKINNELESMMKDLRAKAAARIQLKLQTELQRSAGVESQVNGQLRRLVGAAGSATPKMQRSSDLVSDITRLQARFASVDEQLHNLMLEDNAPTAAYQVTPAVPPMYRAKSGVLRNTALILFAGIVFGILAAVLTHKLDPKIWIAKDAELILGFPPMAQLPDFNEVSSGVAEEYLLRLASSIEHARKQSHMRSCVFTGTSAGNGVSMLVSRVGGMLQAMGRPTILVDASGAPASGIRTGTHRSHDRVGLVPVERVTRPTALLQQMAEETETQEESLVLTDTAPMPVSAETEYLARFVDCAIVVIESGKTTRQQLREAAATLQRLDVAAVGFVLNRVGLEKADPAFRASVQAIEKHLEIQGSHIAFHSEESGAFPASTKWSSEEPASDEVIPIDGSSRTMFEAELAAAGAAVARFSHPAEPELEACLPSPTAHIPDAESAKAFILPLVLDHIAPPVAHSDARAEALPSVEAPAMADSPTILEATDQVQATPLPAPFVEAARHFSSATIFAPALPNLKATGLEPDPETAENINTFAFSEPSPAFPDTTVAKPIAETYEPVSSVAIEEPPPALAHPGSPLHLDSPQVATVSEEHISLVEEAVVESRREARLEDDLAQVSEPSNSTPPTAADSESPSWLREIRHRAPNRPPVLWKPARVTMSRLHDENPAPLPQGPDVSSERFRPGSTPDLAWEPVTNKYNGSNAESAPERAHETEPEELDARLSSRLSGLRNLLFVLGVKNTHDSAEAGELQRGDGASFDLRNDMPAFDQTSLRDRNEISPHNIGGASPRLVTAPPEFLPPQPIVINAARNDTPVGESYTRQDRRPAYDDVDILPSKKGQYKKT